jgi:oligopeptidase B
MNLVAEIHAEEDCSWLRDPNWPTSIDPKIIDYLNSENAKCGEFFAPLQSEVESMFAELKSRIKEDDFTVPIKRDSYNYYEYIQKGQDYWVHARKDNITGAEEILLNENEEAKGKEFYKVGTVEASKDHKLLAYAVDLKGSEKYQVFIKDLDNGEVIDQSVLDIFGDIAWHTNSKGFFYVPTGSEWRADKVYYHEIGKAQADDILIYEETDKTFWVHPELSSSERYLFITSKSGTSSEVRYIDLMDASLTTTLIIPRKDDNLYYVTHHGDYFYIVTNDMGKNYRLVKSHINNPSENWEEVIPHKSDVYLIDITAYKNCLVVEKRILGLTKLEIIGLSDNLSYEVKFKDEVYDARHIFTTFDSVVLRYKYSSLAQPSSIIEYDFESNHYIVRKVQEIPSGYDASKYETKRVWADSKDGVKIPISLLYRKDLLKENGDNPLYLYGYGSYSISIPAAFRTNALSLVDRGFVFAIAHIRGGDDLGYEWYESAKFLTKKRTFEDFIDAADTLIKLGYTSKGRIAICGGSAGGMLIGYCINNAPELYKAAVLHVPFVDVLATMLDDSLPLTPLEFKEWGNPKDPEYYEYIKSYSPVDNVRVQDYPHIFITSGLNDPRVTYWEPAKFAMKLKNNKTDNNHLLLKTNMECGHLGKSGRYDSLKEVAEEYVFIMKTFDKYEKTKAN